MHAHNASKRKTRGFGLHLAIDAVRHALDGCIRRNATVDDDTLSRGGIAV